MSIANDIQALLPPDWHISNLIFLEPDWQVNICDGEYVVIGTGNTIEEAIVTAATNTQDPAKYIGRLFSLGRLKLDEPSKPEDYSTGSLFDILGFTKPKPTTPIRRI